MSCSRLEFGKRMCRCDQIWRACEEEAAEYDRKGPRGNGQESGSMDAKLNVERLRSKLDELHDGIGGIDQLIEPKKYLVLKVLPPASALRKALRGGESPYEVARAKGMTAPITRSLAGALGR